MSSTSNSTATQSSLDDDDLRNSHHDDAKSDEPLQTKLSAADLHSCAGVSADHGHGEDQNKNQPMNGRWDAFASLQANYESSSDDDDDDDDDSSAGDVDSDTNEDSECSNDDFDDNGEFDDQIYRDCGDYNDTICVEDNHMINNNNTLSQKSGRKSGECINLLDSEDEDGIINAPGKENEKNFLPKSRLRKRPTKNGSIESDSDSSLSEEESHLPTKMPSPSMRGLPSWQPPRRQRSSSTPIQTSNHGNIKSSDKFPCMSTRNDVIGNPSSPCIVSSRASKEEGRRRPSKKLSTSTKAASATSTSRKKTRTTSDVAASTGGSKAQARKRRRGGGKYKKRSSYKRSSTKRGGGTNSRSETSNTNGNNAWSERERGIRQPYRRGGGGSAGGGGSSSGPYMAIAKQEPVLRNVGGASIQF